MKCTAVLLGLLGLVFSAASLRAETLHSASHASSNLLVPVASIQCLFVNQRGGFETMVNRCGQCRVAKVTRKRPGSMPIFRTVHVPAGKTVQLPFKGRGQTRIAQETFCANANGDDPNQSLIDRAKCLKLKNMQTAGMVMVNLCDQCRSAVVERVGNNNQKTHQVAVVKGRAYIPIPAQGANSARILSERKCQKGSRRQF